jgi:carbonic anhydrase
VSNTRRFSSLAKSLFPSDDVAEMQPRMNDYTTAKLESRYIFSRRTVRQIVTFLAFLTSTLIFAGCSTSSRSGSPVGINTQTRENQAAITPAQALALLEAGNERFVSGQMIHRDFPRQVKDTSGGQYPFAAVVTCLDSRTTPEFMFDQGVGDIFSARVAGNIINEDILGSLEFATKVSGAKLIAVIGHTNCGAIKGACDDVQLGHLTSLLARIQPAVNAVQTAPDEARSSKNRAFVEKVAEMHVRLTLKAIREQDPILNDLIERGQIGLVGGMYDLETGKVTFFKD